MSRLLLVVALTASSFAHAADWRVWGTVTDKDVLMFYSASDVKRDGNNVRVWIEFLSAKDVSSFDVKAHPETMDKVIARYNGGYRPPYSTLVKMSEMDVVNTVLAEEVANEKASPMTLRALYEIDCVADRTRILAFTQWNDKGEQTYDKNEPGTWGYTPPDTPLANLTRWVCASPNPKK